MSVNSLWPQGLQYPSLSPRVCSKSCPLSQSCHPTISSSVTPISSCPPIFPSIRVFSGELALHISWAKYWSFSFSISSSNEYSRLISFRIEWFDFLVVQGNLKSLLQHHNLKASILQPSAFFVVQLHLYTFFFIVILHSRLVLKTSVWESSILYKSRKKWYHEPLCIWPYHPT